MRTSEMYAPRPTKGFLKTGQRLITFDAVRPCRDDRCPCDDVCPYARGGKCLVEIKYLEAISENLVAIPGNLLTQEFLDKVSLHLIPLFHQLIRFQIRAYGVDDPCYVTAQGAIKVHPIFAEIRKTIAAIESTQKSLGVDLEYHRALGLVKGLKTATKDRNPDAYGDPEYADAVSDETDDMKEEIQSALFPEGVRREVKRARRIKDDSEDASDYAAELEEDKD
jgi:hypothetical protein